MKERTVNAVKKTFTKKALIIFIVVMVVRGLLYSALPSLIAGILIVLFGGAYLIDKLRRELCSVAMKSKYVANAKKTFNRAFAIYSMPDEQFDAIINGRNADTASRGAASNQDVKPNEAACDNQAGARKTPSPIIPNAACVQNQPITDEQAEKLALSWWETPNGEGMNGADMMDYLIQSITMDAPHIHTCDIAEHEEMLTLPKEPVVRTALGRIMRENGLAADINEDGSFIVCWLQTNDGREASSQ